MLRNCWFESSSRYRLTFVNWNFYCPWTFPDWSPTRQLWTLIVRDNKNKNRKQKTSVKFTAVKCTTRKLCSSRVQFSCVVSAKVSTVTAKLNVVSENLSFFSFHGRGFVAAFLASSLYDLNTGKRLNLFKFWGSENRQWPCFFTIDRCESLKRPVHMYPWTVRQGAIMNKWRLDWSPISTSAQLNCIERIWTFPWNLRHVNATLSAVKIKLE